MLRTFPMNLDEKDLDWYNNLCEHSILSFVHLANQFLYHFGINIRKRASITDLSKLSQFDEESISDYVCRWRTLHITSIRVGQVIFYESQ